ncbi:MAG: Rne/Rng family ribonuclease [Actinomycetota bacterium]|nr:Rne/Rng family ribonuclease [Actinomycetota bacterium]
MEKHREILISTDEFETRAAMLEDRQLVEFYLEDAGRPRIAGNIYLGRIKDILPGMEASFVDIGLERNAFLFVNEVLAAEAEFDGPAHEIQNLLKKGQDILVQVLKEPVGTKGARVTAQLALAGRKVVLLPLSKFVGVSKRLENGERTRLHSLADKIVPAGMGMIVRTVADGVEEKDLIQDVEYLVGLWEKISERARSSQAPALVHAEPGLAGRLIRDTFSGAYDRIIVDSPELKQEMQSLAEKASPELKNRIKLYSGKLPLFDKHNIESQLDTALKRRVWLRSGGYIAIDKTEALTGIDVNTAKYTGGRNLEQTIFKTNMEAAVEIVRQLRLRDIGGIIVIDFIDMQEPVHREAVLLAFNKAIENDRTKTRVSEISRLGLVEMTRKNMSEGIQTHFYEACPVCGTGRVLSRRRAAIEAFRRIKYVVMVHSAQAYVFKIAPDIAEALGQEAWLVGLGETSGKRIYIKATPGLERGEATLWHEGTIAQIDKFFDGLGATN